MTKHTKLNYYKILQVDESADDVVIRVAYKALIQKYHPDKNPPEKSAIYIHKTQLIREAYDILSDPEKRIDHDSYIKSHESGGPIKTINPESPTQARSPITQKNNDTTSIFAIIIFLFVAGAITAYIQYNKSENSQVSSVNIYAPNELPRNNTLPIIVIDPNQKATNTDERTIRDYATNISVRIPPSEGGYSSCQDPSPISFREFLCFHRILIPEIAIVVRNKDFEATAKHIIDNKEVLVNELRQKLSESDWKLFIGVDGENTLRKELKSWINHLIGSPIDDIYNTQPGVDNISLPKSFKIQITNTGK